MRPKRARFAHDARESNREYYLRRAREESAKAANCTCPDTRERHMQLARLLFSVAGDHEAGSAHLGANRALATCLAPGLVILPGNQHSR